MRAEVLTGVERRRRWTREQKAEIVMDAERSGVAEAARRHGISRQNVYQWRRQLRERLAEQSGVLVPVDVVADEGALRPSGPAPRVEFDLRSGRRLRVPADLPAELIAKLIYVAEGT